MEVSVCYCEITPPSLRILLCIRIQWDFTFTFSTQMWLKYSIFQYDRFGWLKTLICSYIVDCTVFFGPQERYLITWWPMAGWRKKKPVPNSDRCVFVFVCCCTHLHIEYQNTHFWDERTFLLVLTTHYGWSSQLNVTLTVIRITIAKRTCSANTFFRFFGCIFATYSL